MNRIVEVRIYLKEKSDPLIIGGVIETYQKNGVYCVRNAACDGREITHKYPLTNIQEIIEIHKEQLPDKENEEILRVKALSERKYW